MQCVYGIMYLFLGNISGNAIAFGIYFEIMIGRDPLSTDPRQNAERGRVAWLAVGLLTFCAALHIFTRRGGILLSNILASIKVLMILALAIIGFVHAGGRWLQSKPGSINELPVSGSPFNITTVQINNATETNYHSSFANPRHDVASFVQSLLFVSFSYTGYEQPFYVLSEVKQPRRIFPFCTIGGMCLATFLYMLINISYFCVVPHEAYTAVPANSIDMATTFLHYVFDSSTGPRVARRVAAGLICLSILGNVNVMTFTAARVKQEIAKEGILPFSLFFATSYTTPWAWFRNRYWPNNQQTAGEHLTALQSRLRELKIDNPMEKSPSPALLLHWVTSLLLIAATAKLKPATSYSFLTSLYAFINCLVVGVMVGGGLLYLKIDSLIPGRKGRNWANIRSYSPLIDPLHVIIFVCSTAFLVGAAFVPPTQGSAFTKKIQGYLWWTLPTVGIACLLLGVVWWSGLRLLLILRRLEFIVTRTPILDPPDEFGDEILIAELIEHRLETRVDIQYRGHR
jgi:amino acid transporter